jgi:hypothetical protein
MQAPANTKTFTGCQDDGAGKLTGAYALAMSGNTASILVFSVAALNGLTM